MELSKRLQFIANHIDKCKSIIDVGTDHGYIPIYCIQNNLCEEAIASDINKEPVKKAEMNAGLEGVKKHIDVRLGGGFDVIKAGEVEGSIIAGMGGNLIRDILEKEIEKTEAFKFLILQPAQNPEVLREYLYNNGYEIIDEDLCIDEEIYYELFKVKKIKNSEKCNLDKIYYEISPRLLKDKNKLMLPYLESKEEKYKKILGFIKDNSESALNRKRDIENKLKEIENFKKVL
ncbi:tRNA (adenine22-N1)-methyltransferase [Clostridium sp. DSM 8431]|uniref:tRNA (adenine(22)-N(1))-methyltransferase n=1 Tax=Clostridium sp. DSM 8431 TaxID=1761781 RepID=UPI0008EB2EE5|nr:class I SAM-dependent methyltransferase [Clostridium sp. DSM 8431]SFU48548.1 tRNA (adenine22-N1)-methyltransferase [Clostridium sp. DSM 8431]